MRIAEQDTGRPPQELPRRHPVAAGSGAHDGWRTTADTMFAAGVAVAFASGAALVWLTLPRRWAAGAAIEPATLFHLALSNAVGIAVALAGWQLRRSRHRLRRGWERLDPLGQALSVAGVLVSAELVLAVMYWSTVGRGVDELGYLRAVFTLGGERNAPAVFSASQLAAAAAFAWGCWRLREAGVPRGASAWAASALACGYMAADELLMIHETVGHWSVAAGLVERAGAAVEIGTARVYAWTIVYFPLAVVVGSLLALGFRHQLPVGRFCLLGLAGVVYVAGAVGVENVQAHLKTGGVIDAGTFAARLFLFVEEMLEMLGVTLALFVFAWTYFERRDAVHGRPRSART